MQAKAGQQRLGSVLIRTLQGLSAAVRSLPCLVDSLAQLLLGGLVITSIRQTGGKEEIFAQTLIQLDGDTVTAYSPGLLEASDFLRWEGQHASEVRQAMQPLNRVAAAIKWVRGSLCSLGFGWFVLAATGSFEKKTFWEGLNLAAPILLFVAGLFSRQLCKWIAFRQAGRLLKAATEQAEAIYFEPYGS